MMYTAYTTNFLFPCFQYAETGGINERLFDMIILYLVIKLHQINLTSFYFIRMNFIIY